MRLELLAIANGNEFTAFLHRAIPGELTLRLRPGLFGRVPARQAVGGFNKTSDLGTDTQTDIRAAHFGKTDCGVAAIRFVSEMPVAVAQPVERFTQVAVPLEGIHREVQVSVKDKHSRKVLQERSRAGEAISPSIPTIGRALIFLLASATRAAFRETLRADARVLHRLGKPAAGLATVGLP